MNNLSMNAAGERHLWVWYSPYGMGGVETYLLNMARETIRDGGEVWIAATANAEGPLREMFVKSGAHLLDWSDFHNAYMTDQPDEPVRQRLIADLARIQPTLIALNDCNEFSMGAAPLLRRLRRYSTIMDTFHIDSPVEQYFDFRRTFVDVLDGIAATNQNVIQRFRQRYPDATNVETRYIANGAAVPDRERKPADDTLRLLYVGRLVQAQKRIMDLPPLLERLQARGKAFTMTIVGDGPCREELEAALTQRGLNDRVHLTGYLSPQEAVELYFEHDVLVNISTFEGFSMSVLEAFAAGCVPVCTDVASLDHTAFQDDVNCRLCPVDDLDRMVDIWNDLTPAVLQRLSKAARATGQRYTANQTYLNYRDLLASLRQQRPLQAWPTDAESALQLDWDLSGHNPWLVRQHPLRKLANSAWTFARQALGSGRP